MLWMGQAARTALALLETAGYEAFLVGGCVRDALRGELPSDYDLTTNATPEQMKQVFSAYRVVETGLRHGTLTVLLQEEALEITSYRSEGAYSDGRRPDQVVFCASLEQDLSRRDFTINAMAAHPQKGIIDPYGGQADLQAGLIRCVGLADQRLREDALRIIRALRFASVLGFSIEKETETALFRNRNGLSRISMERIRAELDRLLCGGHVATVLLRYAAIFHEVLPMLWPPTEQVRATELAAAISLAPPLALMRWTLLIWQAVGSEAGDELCVAQRQKAEEILRFLRFSRAQRLRAALLLEALAWPLSAEPAKVRRILSRLGRQDLTALLELRRADALGRGQGEQIIILDNIASVLTQVSAEPLCFTRRDLAIDGRDLSMMGYRGREIGRLLERLLEAVQGCEVDNQTEALRALLQRWHTEGNQA